MTRAVPICACLALLAGSARAALNDWSCAPSAAHPFPMVLVHGQGGHYTQLHTITDAVVAAGHACVFGFDYGLDAAGIPGRAHLDPSGAELAAFVHHVLAATGASKVDLIAYSEGGMVADNFILKKGGAGVVHRVAGLAPGHHPYAHAGAPGLLDNDLFLPNMIRDTDEVVPGVGEQDVSKTAFTVYQIFRGPNGVIDWDLVTSDFVADLFDPVYWRSLHGALSEPDWVFLRLHTAGRSLPTHDAAPGVCYANFVSLIGDLLVGASAGFQDPAPNVDDVAVPVYADHVGIVDDALVVSAAVASLDAPDGCVAQGAAVSGFASSVAVPSGEPLTVEVAPAGGCSAAPGPVSGALGWLLFAVAVGARRRISASTAA
jgi:uncharacterized protein (TIGR03382 family)